MSRSTLPGIGPGAFSIRGKYHRPTSRPQKPHVNLHTHLFHFSLLRKKKDGKLGKSVEILPRAQSVFHSESFLF